MENKKSFYAGIFGICLCTLMYELILTRVFSVLMWYHFASVAISLALFGLAVSGIAVYVFEKPFSKANAPKQMTLFATLFAISLFMFFMFFVVGNMQQFPFFMYKIFASFHQKFNEPFQQGAAGIDFSSTLFFYLTMLYVLMSLPFVFAGFVTSIAMTHYSNKVNKIYFYDLLGAAAGCIVVIGVLDVVSGPTALLFVAFGGCVTGALFAYSNGQKTFLKVLVALSLAFATLIGVNAKLDLTRINFARGQREPNMLSVKWNSFSRVAVYPMNSEDMEQAWGISRTYADRGGIYPMQHGMVVNDTGYTVLYSYPESEEEFEYFRNNVIALPYYPKENPKTLIIGPGGGKDVLTALALGSKDISAIEMNPLIAENVNDDFGALTGYLYNRPEVRLFIDEGRSFIKRSPEQYDVIQASAVYENIAPSAGAFTLSENLIYTKEAFSDYLDHLSEDGILSISRFYFRGFTLRLTATGMSVLSDMGVKDPWNYILIYQSGQVANFMMKRTPFTPQERKIIQEQAREKQFNPLFDPDVKKDGIFNELIFSEDPAEFFASKTHDYRPTTDNKPFFYNKIKPEDFFNLFVFNNEKGFDDRGIILLRNLMYVVCFLNTLFVILPLLVFKVMHLKKLTMSKFDIFRTLLYFVMLGAGFMLVEIILLRRFTLLFGKPIYSLAVILFAILIFSGLGSYISGRLTEGKGIDYRKSLLFVVFALIIILSIAYTYILPPLIISIITLPISLKILVSVLLLAPIGLLLGCPLPVGVSILDIKEKRLIPWGWGLNGSASVLGSILAVALAMNFGFTNTMFFGSACYFVAALCWVGQE